MKKIVMTGGGTSGHVTPNIALMPKLKELGWDIHYIGSYHGIEKQLIENENISYYPINAGKLRRYLDLKNVSDIFRVADGFRQSIAILRKLKPDVLFSKGGFVSCPVVWAAWICKIPVVIHESDMTPGLTNRLSLPFAKKVCYTFPESQGHLPQSKSALTGIPIRQHLLTGDKDMGKKLCGFTDDRPVLMIIGGSQGAESINQAVKNNLHGLLRDYNICHVCGKGNVSPELQGMKGYKQFEYIQGEQPHLYALANIMISRSGATTIFEILALQKPNLLIPLSQKVSRGDQILNAGSFKKQGFSMVLPEEELNGPNLLQSIRILAERKEEFIEAMAKSAIGNAVDNIVKILEGYR